MEAVARPPSAQEEEEEEEEETPSSYLFSPSRQLWRGLPSSCECLPTSETTSSVVSRVRRRMGLLVPSSCPLCCWLLQFRVELCFSPGLWGEGGHIYLDMSSTRAGWRSTPLFRGGARHVTVLCSSSGSSSSLLCARGKSPCLWDSPVAAHLVSLHARRCAMTGAGVDSECRILWKFRSCRSSKFFNIPVVAQMLFLWSCRPWKFSSCWWTW